MFSSCVPPYWDVTHNWFPSGIPILGFPIGLIGLGIYFLPTIIAAFRKHKSIPGIVLVNVFTGWTFIGWIIALVWSLTG